MTEKRMTMYQLEKNLIDELNDNKQEILENDDLIHEYVNSNIPVYNFDRLQLACDDLWLGYPSESGLSEGCDNAYDIIATNIYEKLSQVANDWLHENKKDEVA
jgi:hypothetical protein